MKLSLFALRRLFIALILVLGATSAAFAHEPYTRGTKNFGPKVGFVSRNTSALGGLVFEYSLSRNVRLAPQASIIFRHKNLDGLVVDLDVQFPLPFAGDRCAFYPLVGIGFTSWNKHGIAEGTNKDVSTHLNRFGGNAGAGIEMLCTPTFKVFFEAKYAIIKTYPGAQISAGIAYVF
ncbi:MAG: porin family protein [Muribaculaceae bacterium]|nr:porin family protein [Muribaculaceae bacterium]